MTTQLTMANIADKVLLRLGMIFMAVYAALNCISYGSQVVLVPKLLEAGMQDQLALMNSMTFPGGLLLLPVGVMTVVWGVKSKRSISSAIFNLKY